MKTLYSTIFRVSVFHFDLSFERSLDLKYEANRTTLQMTRFRTSRPP
jgi:hypothetical protein